MLLDPDPVVERLVCELEGAVMRVFGVSIRGLTEILRHLAQRGAGRIKAGEQLGISRELDLDGQQGVGPTYE